jgi:hypothetical protein
MNIIKLQWNIKRAVVLLEEFKNNHIIYEQDEIDDINEIINILKEE